MKALFRPVARPAVYVFITLVALILATKQLGGILNQFSDFMASNFFRRDQFPFSLATKVEELIGKIVDFIFASVSFDPQRTVVKVPGLEFTINNWVFLGLLMVLFAFVLYKVYDYALDTDELWDDVVALGLIWLVVGVLSELATRWGLTLLKPIWAKNILVILIILLALWRGRRGVMENLRTFLRAIPIVAIAAFFLWTRESANVVVFVLRGLEAFGKELVQLNVPTFGFWSLIGFLVVHSWLADQTKPQGRQPEGV